MSDQDPKILARKIEQLERELSNIKSEAGKSPLRVPPVIAFNRPFRIFEVQSLASSDGIYNCYEQTLDATEWIDTLGHDRFDDKDAVNVEVFNLEENNCEERYINQLVVGDRMICWQWIDDEGNVRWVGIPLRRQEDRLAYCNADAGAGTTITCRLDSNDGSATIITVNCCITGGANLNAAIPRLVSGDPLLVKKIGNDWYCTTKFQVSEDCDCYIAT